MKLLFLSTLLVMLPGGEREKGLQLYRDGQFVEAAAAFRAAIEQEGDSAELQWNLALACYGAGDFGGAETAAEKYAALSRQARPELHAGMLGAVRHGEAKQLEAHADALASPAAPVPTAADQQPEDPLPVMEQALAKAQQASDYFERGAAAKATPELLRNAERCQRTIAELEKKIEELKKQREEQEKDDDKKNEDKKDEDKTDDKKDEQQKKDDEQKPDENKSDESKPGDKQDNKDEPKPGEPKGDEKPEPKPEDSKGESGPEEPKPEPPPKDGEQQQQETKRQDAPGEQQDGKELTPEQAQHLLEQLKQLDEQMKSIRARAKSGRRPVERDW